jgi:hypothetical protein
VSDFTHTTDLYQIELRCRCGRGLLVTLIMPGSVVEGFDCICGEHTTVNRFPPLRMSTVIQQGEPK